MIPLHLRITGFLSYHETVDLDFSTFELACISGQNGAGKSSLLDAFTWTLFGKARASQNEAIINLQSKAAEVALTFEYEGNIFRVIRALQRGKSTTLEFQVADRGPQTTDNNGQRSMVYGLSWKPLTEKSTRETQARIEQTLRLDYETFINASFFLQGNADQFTQQNASKRKDVLSNILGLEVWEQYKERTSERRKLIERDVNEIEGRVAEIDAELSEEDTRKARLTELEKMLKQLSVTRAAQESALDLIKKNAASLDEQKKLVDTLSASLERTRSLLTTLQARLAAKETERAAYADLVGRAKEIEAEYKALQKSRKELEGWEKVAAQFHEHQKERAPLLEGIAGEKARLEQERASLSGQSAVISDQLSDVSKTEQKIEAARQSLSEAEVRIKERIELEARRNTSREKQAEMKAENDALKVDMNLLKERIETLKAAEGASCPLCGQALSKEHRKSTLKQLEEEGREKGDRYRTNQAKSVEISKQITNYELQITELANAENERIKHSNSISQLTERIETLQNLAKEWESMGRKRLSELTKLLENKKYAVDVQKQLAKLDKELAKLGYDISAHDEARRKENSLRSAEDSFRELASAREVSKQIEDEIKNLNEESRKRQDEIVGQESAFNQAAESLKNAQAHAPNMEEAERGLYRLREEENNARAEMGAARQKVDVLETQRVRKAKLSGEREEFQKQIAHHKTLERAFGKDGVPALLIEQSLPQIESKANDLLDRLSNGQMSMRFVTQEVYKDKKRDDLKETLDIQISDSAGVRDYEMYSIDGSEPVYIRKNGKIICQSIQSLWEKDKETRIDGNYEFQAADYDTLCYEDGKVAWTPAQSILRHPAPQEMLKIKLKPGGYSVTITPNHSIYVISTKGLDIKRGDEIQPGDYVLTPQCIPAGDTQEQIDFVDWISPEFSLHRENESKKINYDDTHIWSRIDQSIFRFAPNREQFAELLGLVVAEGSGRDAYTISAGTNAEMAERVVNLSNHIFGTNRDGLGKISAEVMAKYVEKNKGFSSRAPKEQYRPFISGRLVAHILGNMVGSGASQKHIPGFIFNSPKEAKFAFLESLIAGDGHVRIRLAKSQIEIGITTISPYLVADVIFLCRMLGIWARVERHDDAGFRGGINHKHSYRIALSGGANVGGMIDSRLIKTPNRTAFEGIPLDLIGIVRNTKQKRIKRVKQDERFVCGSYVVPLRNQKTFQQITQWLEDWSALEVASVEKTQPVSPFVYDLVVPQNHTFVAGTGLILVHNSGGEAFRINFAIRLALSEVLAQRKGARLQTLVIDEGFGSQDVQGRQRLIEAINLVKKDFAKILVITHLDELKDAFPTRIEVEKTEHGSIVSVK